MRQILILLIFVVYAFALQNQHATGQRLLSCYRCTASQPDCTRTCRGFYCYKQDAGGSVKSGCLNQTDTLSKVNECSERLQEFGGETITEKFCICTGDKCNSASRAFLLVTGGWLLTHFLLQ